MGPCSNGPLLPLPMVLDKMKIHPEMVKSIERFELEQTDWDQKYTMAHFQMAHLRTQPL